MVQKESNPFDYPDDRLLIRPSKEAIEFSKNVY